MAEQDDELELKKRARRRLVGAATFAIVAVAVLPLVMDEQPPPIGADIPIRIPEQDQPFEPAPAKRPAVPVLVAPSPPDTSASESVSAAPAAAPAEAKQDSEKSSEPKQTAKAQPVDSKAAEANRAKSILEGRDSSPEYVVLIGAFAEASNVKNLTSKLDDLGIKTYTENVSLPQGKRTRVRAGPFDSQDEARRAAEKMKRIGVNGVVAAKP